MPFTARAQAPGCDAALYPVRFIHPLTHVAEKLKEHRPIVIVAIGSSSTAGAGASSPAANYPSRLQVELNRRLLGQSITVVNRGINGEEVGDMLKRFDKAVIAAKPDLVLWQLGTNSVLRNHPLLDHGAAIRAGLDKIRSIDADVVLIDPQFAPKVIAKPDAAHMVALIAMTAKQDDVDLFPRYDMMRRWSTVDHLSFASFVSRDGVHMNDWSYACLAQGLGMAIAEAATRPMLSAKMVSPLRDYP
jgi:acyl-CoA thioesterase I